MDIAEGGTAPLKMFFLREAWFWPKIFRQENLSILTEMHQTIIKPNITYNNRLKLKRSLPILIKRIQDGKKIIIFSAFYLPKNQKKWDENETFMIKLNKKKYA